jgi:protein O-mannosyl-transferase
MVFSNTVLHVKNISRSWLWGALVLLLAMLSYANTLPNGFVWDDEPIIVKNPLNRDSTAIVQIVKGLDTSRVTEKTPYYRPLTRVTYWAEYQVHGLNPTLCHLANVVLHAINAFLVYRLGLLLFALEFPAAVAAILFAVHPVNSEAVNFLSTRNTLLSTLFVLAAFIAFIRGMEGGRGRAAIWTGIFFFGGILCKESALFLIPLLPISVALLSQKPPRESLYKSFPAVAICTVVAILYLYLRQQVLNNAGITVNILPDLAGRLLDILYLIPCSFLPIIWPAQLSPYYPLPEAVVPLIPLLTVAWMAIVALVIWVFTRGRCAVTIVGLCWYVVFYLPVSGIIPIPSAPMAERYLYLPAIGVWIITAEIVRRCNLRYPAHRALVITAVALSVVTFGIRTVIRNLDWRSNYTLFSRLVETSPQQAFAHHSLGTAYLDDIKDLSKAQDELEKTLALDSYYPRTHTVLGYIQMQRGELGRADFHLTQAIIQDPNDAEAQYNKAIILEQLGKPAEAVQHLEKFLAINNPEFAASRSEAESKLRALKVQSGKQ